MLNIKVSAQFANIKLIKPVVPKENRIGISNIEEIVDTNYTMDAKWTIIRDINGWCLDKILNYNSIVLDMDKYTDDQRLYVRENIRRAIRKGLWVTFSFKDKLCTIHELLLKNVLPADIL